MAISYHAAKMAACSAIVSFCSLQTVKRDLTCKTEHMYASDSWMGDELRGVIFPDHIVDQSVGYEQLALVVRLSSINESLLV